MMQFINTLQLCEKLERSNFMKLRNVIFKTKNIIIQEVRKSTNSDCKTCIIMGSGYSLSVDEENNVIHKDPLFFPPSGNVYGDYTVLSLFYPFECEGLSVAAKELANYIDTNMKKLFFMVVQSVEVVLLRQQGG